MTFTGFDIFVILFTVLIAMGVVGLLRQPNKNLFALGFGAVSLATFLVMDVLMVASWMGISIGLPKF